MGTDFQIDLRATLNVACRECTDVIKNSRKKNNGTCLAVSAQLDGRPIRCVGEWAYRKIYFLSQYLGIFTGVAGPWKGHLNYLEICSGPGRCILQGSLQEVDGTALRVVNSERFAKIENAVFLDYDKDAVAVLNERIADLGQAHKAKAIVADYTDPDTVIAACSHFSPRSLNLVFVDPTDCSVPFASIKAIVERLRNVDLLINFALGTDVTRNLARAIVAPDRYADVYAKYQRALGDPDFWGRDVVQTAASMKQHGKLRMLFREAYIAKLKGLGFNYFDEIPVRHFYELLFATSNKKGIDFWKRIAAKDEHGQGQLGLL